MGIVVKQGNSLLKTGNYILAVKDFTFGYLQNENCVTNHFTTQYRSKIVIDDIAGLFYTITYDETISLPVVGVYSLTDFKLKNTINFGTSFSGGAANSYSLAIDNVKNNVLYVMDSLYIIRVFSLTDYSLVGSILPKAGYQFCDICLKSDGSTLYATTGVYQSAVPTLFSYETNNFNLLKSYSFTPTIGSFSSFPTITYDNSRNELWTFSITNGDPSRCFQILDADTFLLKNTISGNRLSGFSGSNTGLYNISYDQTNDIVVQATRQDYAPFAIVTDVIKCKTLEVLPNYIPVSTQYAGADWAFSKTTGLMYRLGLDFVEIYKRGG